MTDKVTKQRVVFSQADATALKSFAGLDGRGLRIIGFQDRATLRDVDNIAEASMVYPFEHEIAGSTRVFAALWQTLIEKDKIAVARYVRAQGSEPKFVALVPERERVRATGEQDMPPCLYAVTLPFATDQRAVPADAVDTACADVPAPALGAARDLVAALSLPGAFDLFRSPPGNPRLQAFYATLEGFALNLCPDEVAAPHDSSIVDAAVFSAEQRLAIGAFGAAAGAVAPTAAAAKAPAKRKRA
jgi:ATP-dependent DNA helicase 2 subunit 1